MPTKSLRNVFLEAQAPYEELTMRLLFCMTIRAGSCLYRIREIEIYAEDDPYTHLGDEQVSTCGGWYFHRTKPGGGWKGGTFMGMDISFAPVGTAGGVLLRGMSRCHNDNDDNDDDDHDGSKYYFDGSCNCVRELLRACGVTSIRDLVAHPDFEWDALSQNGILRLVENEEPRALLSAEDGIMEWKATSRVGLTDPSKRPEQRQARQKYQLAPLRFLSAPFETRKEKTKITSSEIGGIFTVNHFKQWELADDNDDDDDDDDPSDNNDDEPNPKKLKTKHGDEEKKKGDDVELFPESDSDDEQPKPKKKPQTKHGQEKTKGQENYNNNDSDEDHDEQPKRKKRTTQGHKQKKDPFAEESDDDDEDLSADSDSQPNRKKLKQTMLVSKNGKEEEEDVVVGMKNKGPPKGAMTSFMFFANEIRDKVKKDNPTASIGEIGKIIGTRYRALSKEEQQKYIKMAESDKERYQRAMLEYKKQMLQPSDPFASSSSESDSSEPSKKKLPTKKKKKQDDKDKKNNNGPFTYNNSDKSSNSTSSSSDKQEKKLTKAERIKKLVKCRQEEQKKKQSAKNNDDKKNSMDDDMANLLGRPLKHVLLEAKDPYTELSMRLLFCTTLSAGSNRYRFRDIEIFSGNDPYTQKGDEQVATCGGWYFHRTKPGGGWKGGTFMGMDLSFAPVGTPGGILLRGMSRIQDNINKTSSYRYFDGPCNCVREILRACGGHSKIADLVNDAKFQWQALSQNGILRLIQHEPRAIPTTTMNSDDDDPIMAAMEWKVTSRIGLSEPEKQPELLEARQKFHLKPLRFLAGPYETKKEKTKVTKAPMGGTFTIDQFQTFQVESDDGPSSLFGGNNDGVDEYDSEEDSDYDDDDDGDDKASDDKNDSNSDSDSDDAGVVMYWHYWLDQDMDGKQRGWHRYGKSAHAKLEEAFSKKEKKTTIQSGFFSYQVDLNKMTQQNATSGTVRPIRRVHQYLAFSMTKPPNKKPLNIKLKIKKEDTIQIKKEEEEEATPLPDKQLSTNNKAKTKNGSGSGSGGLQLEPLFAGQHGHSWEGALMEVLESLPRAAEFIGPSRNKEILPVREMTFRALMALPPEQNNLIVFGQAPYPRVESASGIAMFDSLIKDWDCPQFGKTVSMRCIAKTAAVAHGLVSQNAKIADLRKAFHTNHIVSPPQWFQAMLAQGVLLLNASLTNKGGMSTAQHTKFWMPVINRIVEEILRSKRDKFPPGAPKRRIGFLWWGNEALKTKKSLHDVLSKYEDDVEITHMEHFNPAAQGDKFSQLPNHFQAVNTALTKGNLQPINWLPDKAWLTKHHVDDHAAFITETQELHKFYLDRLQAGLDTTDLKPIVGVMASKLCSLPDACEPLGLRSSASSALASVNKTTAKQYLNEDEKGAVYLYTTNVLYRRLNEALQNPDRSRVLVYFEYLRVFLEAHAKMKAQPKALYRGINKDLGALYKEGTNVTWWTVSSCTPNISVAKSFGGDSPTGTLFHVESKTGVSIMDLSAYKSEEEYVLAPGTILKVQKVVKKPSQVTQIYLEEMEIKRWVQ